MLSYGDALKEVLAEGRRRVLSIETVPTPAALGRVLAREVVSPESIPAFDNSAMDGFAVRACDTASATAEHPVELRVGGLVAAGATGEGLRAAPGLCCEIMTGAAIPAGFDSIVKVEDTVRERGASVVRILRAATPGDHVRRAGEDFKIGAQVLGAGTVLRARHLLPLGAMGITEVAVYRKPRVAIIPTGTELVDVEVAKLAPGQIRNSTAPFLAAELEALGCDVRICEIIRDEPARFQALLEELFADQGSAPDLVITTGAVSMGLFDFIRPALEGLGARVFFHKVAMRPGKPVLFAGLERGERRAAFFGLPGNPVSTAVGLRFFVEPYLRAIASRASETRVDVELVESVKKPEGLTCFYKAVLKGRNSKLSVRVLPGQASFQVGPLALANAWAILPEKESELEKGAVVKCVALSSAGFESLGPGSSGGIQK